MKQENKKRKIFSKILEIRAKATSLSTTRGGIAMTQLAFGLIFFILGFNSAEVSAQTWKLKLGTIYKKIGVDHTEKTERIKAIKELIKDLDSGESSTKEKLIVRIINAAIPVNQYISPDFGQEARKFFRKKLFKKKKVTEAIITDNVFKFLSNFQEEIRRLHAENQFHQNVGFLAEEMKYPALTSEGECYVTNRFDILSKEEDIC